MSADSLMPPMPAPPTCESEKQDVFDAVVRWMLDNYGLLTRGESRGAGLVAPLRTREMTATGIAAFKTMLLPYRIIAINPATGAVNKITPLDMWLTLPNRVEVAGFRTEPEKPWPTFTQDGVIYINLYLRPELPEDGDARMGHEFLEKLFPDERERTWYKQRIAFKLRYPAIPGPSVVHVAQNEYGVGRGTWFKILTKMFGHWYIARPEFKDTISDSGQAVYNEWMATSILALVNEMSHEEDHRYTNKQMAYERIKELVDTSRQIRRIKGKYEKLYNCECGPGFEFASNHSMPVAVPDKDRRVSFLTNGLPQPPKFYVDLNDWMAAPGNIGAFRRDLEAIDLTGFNPYAPLLTALRDVAIEDSRSTLDEAIDLALGALPGEIMLTAQVIDAIEILRARQRLHLHSEWQALAVRETKKRGRRIGARDGVNWKPFLPQRNQRAAVYARSEEERVRWTAASPVEVLTELQKNEAAIEKLRKALGRMPPFATVET